MEHATARPASGTVPISKPIVHVVLALLWLFLGFRPSVVGAQARSFPTDEYTAYFSPYFSGEFREALAGFRSAARSAVRSSQGRWIDSICYYTMMGESLYQLGDTAAALEQFDTALSLYLTHRTWMQAVEFPPVVAVAPRPLGAVPTWGSSKRRSRMGNFSETLKSLQGRLDNDQVVKRGGVVSAPQLVQVRAYEVARCTALALRRRAELLGPVAAHVKLTDQLVDALARRPAPASHWSQAWIHVPLGLAYIAAGKNKQAITELENGLMVGGELDHPLTAIALLELGKLALADGKWDVAGEYFLEASYSGALFAQADIVEESLRWAHQAHLAAHPQQPFAPLGPALVWARQQRLAFLQASLLVSSAEEMANSRQTQGGVRLLEEAVRGTARNDANAGAIGARLQYQRAHLAYQRGDAAEGDTAWAAAMTLQQRLSPRLFQIGLVQRLHASRGISERIARDLFAVVLREPNTGDWLRDPLEAFALSTSPLHEPLATWFHVQDRSVDRALEIADRIRRQRFATSLPMGSRLLALRWVLHAPEELLSKPAQLQRQDLLVKYPEYVAAMQAADELQTRLREMPTPLEDASAARDKARLLDELAKTSTIQEGMLRHMAVRREAVDVVFPPARSLKEIQKSLSADEIVLTFASTKQGVDAFMISSDQQARWTVGPQANVRRQVASLLKAMGNLDPQTAVADSTLRGSDWKKPAAALLDLVIEKRQRGYWNRYKQLIVVPDDVLWYVPFEALQIADSPTKLDTAVSLIDKMQVRYLPFVSLVGANTRPARESRQSVLIAGKLYPRDTPEVAEGAAAELQEADPTWVRLESPLLAPTGVYRTCWDRLLVWDDVNDLEKGVYAWAPAQIDSGRKGSELGRWMALPWGSPETVLLPGYHSAAAGALKQASVGDDIFLPLSGLMSTGVRTILLSRWRTGGQNSVNLVREFSQEAAAAGAAAAWSRSLQLARSAELDLSQEPRVKSSDTTAALTGEHPFFWAGYLVVDATGNPQAPAATPNANANAIAKEPEKEPDNVAQ